MHSAWTCLQSRRTGANAAVRQGVKPKNVSQIGNPDAWIGYFTRVKFQETYAGVADNRFCLVAA